MYAKLSLNFMRKCPFANFLIFDIALPFAMFASAGQDQDFIGGGFNIRESFIGELSQFGMFDRLLRGDEILALASGNGKTCKHAEGNVVSWTDFAAGLHGDVILRNTSWCLGL